MVSNRSIRRYRWRGPKRERSQTWQTFLRNQIKGIWAADLLVRTFRQECLDHIIIVLNERHLLALLTEFVRYYNHDRPHRALELGTPAPRPPMSGAAVVSRPILSGHHHVYARAA